MRRAAAVAVLIAALAAAPAAADHGVGLRTEGMSPLTSALFTGGLAFVVALVVVIVIMVMTRPSPDRRSGQDGE